MVIAALDALSALAITAVTIPSVFAYYMVDKGEWSRLDACRFLLEIGYAWLQTGASVLIPVALGQAGASRGLIRAFANAMSRLSWLAKVLEAFLIASITIILVGVALLIGAAIWLWG